MEEDVLEWAIANAFRSLERRARVIEQLIATHRAEFGQSSPQPSIDAICIGMATLTALAKYRFEDETDRYPEQFRELLRVYARESFSDRVSIPELMQNGAARGIPQDVIDSTTRQYPQTMRGSNYPPESDPPVDDFLEWLHDAGFAEPAELWRFYHSSLIYEKYRNPVFHSLRIADGDEPHNMWYGSPEMFYSNKLERDNSGVLVSVRLFGVMDTYFLRLVREVTQTLREWCIRERRWLFD